MSLLNQTIRGMRASPSISRQLLRSQYLSKTLRPSFNSSRHLATGPPPDSPKNSIDPIALHRLAEERRAYYKRRSYYSGAGFIFGMIAIWVLATSVELPPKPSKLDSGVTSESDRRKQDALINLGKEKKVVVQKLGEEPEENVDVVQTGTSTVPTFPRLLGFVDTVDEAAVPAEYQLVGLGIRTVSFLKVQVYVVGMYIATDDIAELQQALIRKIDPIATTLVAGEKDKLKDLLLDGDKSEEIWNQVLKETKVRSLIRVVPTRNTDFGHLRDAWVRGLTARAKRGEEFAGEDFGASVASFKSLFTKGSVPKQKELLLARNKAGALAVWYDNDMNGPTRLGSVDDERVSRSVWLNYLGGKNVASEDARKSIVEGVMEFVERPVGTVATQVHV